LILINDKVFIENYINTYLSDKKVTKNIKTLELEFQYHLSEMSAFSDPENLNSIHYDVIKNYINVLHVFTLFTQVLELINSNLYKSIE